MKQLFLAFAAILALVAAFSFMEGVTGYVHGTAVMRGVGYPGRDYWNLDPKYRVYWQTSGCLVSGTEILTHVPNNLAIMALTNAFGPMRGTYHGPYPSRTEASEALRASRDVVAADAIVAVRMGAQPALDCQALAVRFPPSEGQPVARCAMFRDRTIVLWNTGEASLVDAETGKAYARYPSLDADGPR